MTDAGAQAGPTPRTKMNQREQGYDAVDATVFSSDMLYQPEELAVFKIYLARWNRAVQEHESDERAQPQEPT